VLDFFNLMVFFLRHVIYIGQGVKGAKNMIRLISTILIMMFLSMPAQAMSRVNAGMIRDAQEYGQRYSKQEPGVFLLPWTVYEERSVQIGEAAERAYLYTPYLLIALNAKDNEQNGISPKLEDSERILSDYNGFLTFETILYGDTAEFTSELSASLQQDKKRIKQYQIVFPSKPKAIIDRATGLKLYKAQGYIYFSDKGLNPTKPVRLAVIPADNRVRHFYFDLPRIR